MRQHLEQDLRFQEAMLARLRVQREGLVDGSEGALHLDRLIGKVEDLIRVYQIVKCRQDYY